MLDELRIKVECSIEMMCDNQVAIAIANNFVHHDRKKHVEIDRHFISEKIEGKMISLKHVPSQFQAANIFTKALHHPNFQELSPKLGLKNIYHPT